jgi:hypothetical protein
MVENSPDSRRGRGRRFLIVLAVFTAAAVHSLLPRGAFGTHDLLTRAAITGAAAGLASLVFLR